MCIINKVQQCAVFHEIQLPYVQRRWFGITSKLTELLTHVNKHSSIYSKQLVVSYNNHIYEIINYILTKTSKSQNEVMIMSLYLERWIGLLRSWW